MVRMSTKSKKMKMAKKEDIALSIDSLVNDIKQIIEQGRQKG